MRTLEEQLAVEGNPHVLQLNMFNDDDPGDWKNPTRWSLYADGVEIATGDGAYARDCFRESAEAFRDLCRGVVEGAGGLLDLSDREYRLLSAAREIARHEAFDNGTHVFGASSQPGRA